MRRMRGFSLGLLLLATAVPAQAWYLTDFFLGQPGASPSPAGRAVSGAGYTDPITGMEFAYVPAGCYQMGDTFGDGESDEKPAHQVCLNSFSLGKTEVTVGQFRRFVNATGYRTEAEQGAGCEAWNGSEWAMDSGKSWRDPGYTPTDSQPVVCVSWNDATAMAKWLAEIASQPIRLPTEAEWEYAARSGGRAEKYAGGDNVDAVAWYRENSGRECHAVAQKQANGLGLFDMTGNVWEWCNDWFSSSYYGQSPKDNPPGPSGDAGHVKRGGSWNGTPVHVRAAYRNWKKNRESSIIVGFRLALAAGSQGAGADANANTTPTVKKVKKAKKKKVVVE